MGSIQVNDSDSKTFGWLLGDLSKVLNDEL